MFVPVLVSRFLTYIASRSDLSWTASSLLTSDLEGVEPSMISKLISLLPIRGFELVLVISIFSSVLLHPAYEVLHPYLPLLCDLYYDHSLMGLAVHYERS